MEGVNWRLDRIHSSGDFFKLLKSWFKQDVEALHAAYGIAEYKHLFNMRDFRRQNPNGKKLERHAFKLFVLRQLMSNLAVSLNSIGYRKSKSWVLSNCRPAGGRWVPRHWDHTPAGKECGLLICPWCYLRRYERIRKKLVELGLTEPLTVTRFRFEDKLLDFNRDMYGLIRSKVDRQIRAPHDSDQPEFETAIRLFGLVPNPGNVVSTHAAISYLHNGGCKSGSVRLTTSVGTSTVQLVMTRAKCSFVEAMQLAQPYPIHLTDSAPTVKFLLEHVQGIHTLGVVTIPART